MLRGALIFAAIVVCLPALISEAIGGWTTQYTSPSPIFAASSMPSLAGKTALVVCLCSCVCVCMRESVERA